MRSGGGKSKGSSFERQVCKDLSLWLSQGERSDLLWRSAMSGGRSTVAFKTGLKLKSQVGDISSIDILSHKFIDTFIIECKHLKNLDLSSIIKNTGTLVKFWIKLNRDAYDFDKLPILIARQNNWPIIVCLDVVGMRSFKLDYPSFRLVSPKNNLHIFLLDEFLEINPKVLERKRIRL